MLTRTPPAKEQRPAPKPSAPERPKFAWERFGAIHRELPKLFERHWQEVALNHDKVPLDPDWDKYFQLDIAGMLRVLTVRVEERLVGYHFILIYPALHYFSTMTAESDMFYLLPRYRKGLTGYRLLKIARDTLAENGVKMHAINIKLHIEQDRGTLAPLLRRMGYTATEVQFVKLLGDD